MTKKRMKIITAIAEVQRWKAAYEMLGAELDRNPRVRDSYNSLAKVAALEIERLEKQL